RNPDPVFLSGLVSAADSGTFDRTQARVAGDRRQAGFAKIVGAVLVCSDRSVSNELAVTPVSERHQAVTSGGAEIRSGSNPENPNRNNGPEHGQAGNRPARRVDRTIRFGPVHHGIVPVGHDSLLEIASGR